MKTNQCVLSCTADGRIVEMNALELFNLLKDADEYVTTLKGVGTQAAYYLRLASVCESTRNYGQALSMLRKALALYCRHDLAALTQHYVHAAKSCARRIDRLRHKAFGGSHTPGVAGDVTAFYTELYWLRLLDEKPQVWDLYCEQGLIPPIDSAQWQLICQQLTQYGH